jgi:hypothetical protein
MAKRKRISVRRAAYRKPSPTANRRAVNRTRDVRESISVKSYPNRVKQVSGLRCQENLIGFLTPET